jgi:PAS domain S-box-containing protein
VLFAKPSPPGAPDLSPRRVFPRVGMPHLARVSFPAWLSLAGIGLLAVTYFAAAKLGLSLATMHGNVTLVWPPTGIALAALLRFGYGAWPGVALGALLINASTSVSLPTAAGIAAGNTLEAVVGVYLLHRVTRFRSSLERLQDVLGLVLIGAAVCTTLSATIGVGSLFLGGSAAAADYGSLWWQWWLGDAMGALVVAPVLLTWRRAALPEGSPRRLVEIGVLFAGLVAVSLVVFGGWLTAEPATWALAFTAFPLVAWAALRFGPPGAATASLVLSALATWGTVRRVGPFLGKTPTESLLVLQIFMSVVAVTALVLAAVISQRRRAEETARALAEVGHELVGALDFARVSSGIVSTVLQLFRVRHAALHRLDAASGGLTCVALAGDQELSGWVGRTLPPGEGLAGRAVEIGRAVWTSDLLSDAGVAVPAWLAQELRRASIGAVAAVPLIDRGETLGTLTLRDVSGRIFLEEDMRLLTAFADQAALVFRNAQLYEEVKQTRDFLQSIAEHSADAIVTADVSGRLTYVSPGAEEMFGYPAGEILGQPITSFYRSAPGEARTLAKQVRAEGRVRSYETAVRARDGRWVPVIASISLLRSARGTLAGTLAVIKDITEREAVEAARREVAELRAITLLAGGVAHEINNPLAVVLGQLELIAAEFRREGLLKPMRRLDQAHEAGIEIRDIVARMTRLTRIAKTPSDLKLPPILDIRRSSDPGEGGATPTR